MTTTDRYVVVLAGVLLGTSVLFAWSGETRVSLVLSVYIIETFTVNQLFVWLSARARVALHAVERVLVLCFVTIVVSEVARILAG